MDMIPGAISPRAAPRRRRDCLSWILSSALWMRLRDGYILAPHDMACAGAPPETYWKSRQWHGLPFDFVPNNSATETSAGKLGHVIRLLLVLANGSRSSKLAS
jgi:hypothetical protein